MTVLDGKEKVGDGIDLLGRSAVPVGGGRGDQGFTGLGLWFEVVQAAIPAQCRHIQRAEVDSDQGRLCFPLGSATGCTAPASMAARASLLGM